MSNLSAATTYSDLEKYGFTQPQTFRVANAVRIYMGALTGLPGTNALTSSRGLLQRWQDQVNLQWCGIAESESWTASTLTAARTGTPSNVNSVLGNTSNTPVDEITVETAPVILGSITVTGVAAQTDVWRTPVYCSTDNYTDITTTATTYSPSIGRVLYWYSSTTADILIYGMLIRALTTVS